MMASSRRPHRLRRLVCCSALAALPLTCATVAPAVAQAAGPTITSPANGTATNNAAPAFSGACEFLLGEVCRPVTLYVHEGLSQAGPLVGEPVPAEEPEFSDTWSAALRAPLPDGTYTAVAEEEGLGETPSNPVTFTVDTQPPHVAITSPGAGSAATGTSQVISGSAGTAAGDTARVKVNLYSGAAAQPQAYVQAVETQVSAGGWTATFGGLAPGTYTARAEQGDSAGNVGASAPVTFSLASPSSPPPPGPPAASFTWFPNTPVVGERVSLVSTSADSASPITSYAWDNTGSGPFKAGGAVLTTTFSTSGNHVVRLRITDARGYSSTAVETVPVARARLTPMQPFPIVRIAGTLTANGVRLSLLSVQAPVGARVTVGCARRHCHMHAQSRTAVARGSRAGAVSLSFRRFERALRAGIVLEIRVSMPGAIGKFTRFAIRAHRLPSRTDACLASTEPRPIACPA
jgi:hypothetical protein